jgi:hypothetical protein
MKIREIIREDESPQEQLGNQFIDHNLVPVLMFLIKRSDDREVAPSMNTDSLIQLVRNAGDNTFDYNALVKANDENPAVKNLITSFNRQTITLKSTAEQADSGDDEDITNADDEETAAGYVQSPEETVDQMAKSAATDRGAPI